MVIPGILAAEFKVVQYWNGVANDNKKIALAVRANSEIKDCTWIHLDTEDEYRFVLPIKNCHSTLDDVDMNILPGF